MATFTHDYAAQARTASGINILLGIWLIVSPWVFNYSGRGPVLNSVYGGALIALLRRPSASPRCPVAPGLRSI